MAGVAEAVLGVAEQLQGDVVALQEAVPMNISAAQTTFLKFYQMTSLRMRPMRTPPKSMAKRHMTTLMDKRRRALVGERRHLNQTTLLRPLKAHHLSPLLLRQLAQKNKTGQLHPLILLLPNKPPNLPQPQSYLGHRLHGTLCDFISPPQCLFIDLKKFSPHEKPAPVPTPVPSTTATHSPTPAQIPSNPPPPPVVEPEPAAELQESTWEEPTTVEAPVWDEEPPQTKQEAEADSWPPSTEAHAEPQTTAAPTTSDSEPQASEASATVSEPVTEVAIVDVKPAQPAAATPVLSTQVASPSPKLTNRPAVASHRSSARYKVTDQPVTLPLSFGSGIEKVGMQFGSLSLADGSSTSPSTQYVVRVVIFCLSDTDTN